MLDIKRRQKYLKALGFYAGKVDGAEGTATKKAYLALQTAYFVRFVDKDGRYGPNTDTLLMNAYRVFKYTKNFSLKEFRCGCGGKHCAGYPVQLDADLLANLQKIRDKYGVPMTITSGLRCQKFNDSLAGSIKSSKHTKGKAADFKGTLTNTKSKRTAVKTYFKKLPQASYTYSDTANMGQAVHVDVK